MSSLRRHVYFAASVEVQQAEKAARKASEEPEFYWTPAGVVVAILVIVAFVALFAVMAHSAPHSKIRRG